MRMSLKKVDTKSLVATYLKASDGTESTIELPSRDCALRLYEWLEGRDSRCIQKVVPELSPDDRERCLTGIEPDEWDNLFADDDDDDDNDDNGAPS